MDMNLEILQRAMNMFERVRTMPDLTGISMIGFGILLVFGILNCILGYRLLRFWMMLFGFGLGALGGLAGAYTAGVSDRVMTAGIAVGAGAVIAILAFASYKAGIFLLGAGLGLGLGIYFLHPTSSQSFFVCLLIGVGVGVLAMKWAREILIIGTSLFGGALAGFAVVKLTYLDEIPYGLVCGAGFAVAGILIQFATNRKKYEDEEEDEEEREDLDDSDYVDPREYIPQRRSKAERQEDKIQRELEKEERKLAREARKERKEKNGRSEKSRRSGKSSNSRSRRTSEYDADEYEIDYDLDDLESTEDSDEFDDLDDFNDQERIVDWNLKNQEDDHTEIYHIKRRKGGQHGKRS